MPLFLQMLILINLEYVVSVSYYFLQYRTLSSIYHCIFSTIQIYSPFMPFIMSPFFITVNPVSNFRSCTVENFSSRTLISILYVYYSDKNYFAAVLRFHCRSALFLCKGAGTGQTGLPSIFTKD